MHFPTEFADLISEHWLEAEKRRIQWFSSYLRISCTQFLNLWEFFQCLVQIIQELCSHLSHEAQTKTAKYVEDGMEVRTHDGGRARNWRSMLSPKGLSKRMGTTPHPLKSSQAEGPGSSLVRVLSCRFIWAVMKLPEGERSDLVGRNLLGCLLSLSRVWLLL